jgi:mannose-1-phosphate guanylyltransferase/mannose-6-phosphate isomerase
MGVQGSLEEALTRRGTAEAVRPVILCGGAGSRLWPLSRSMHPKQLLPIAGTRTMLQATVARAASDQFGAPLIVTGEDHRFMVKDQLETGGIAPAAIILEPEGRNTAAAIAVAAQQVIASGADDMLLVMPSDHVINDVAAFHAAVAAALPAVRRGALATFGIHARSPETGYGYIQAGDAHSDAPGVLTVARFVEKPDMATAERYVASGDYFWNGGIFLFKASTLLEELGTHAPAVAEACADAIARGSSDGVFFRPEPHAFRSSPNISIDYAVMEKTHRACVVPVNMGWSDVGSWDALWEIAPKDEDRNAISGDVVAIDTKGSLLRSETSQMIATVGVEDLTVVATRDAVLVMPRDRAQDVKLVVDALKASNRDSHRLHPQVHRPWGSYETMDRGDRFQTKRIIVKPGEKLSLQMHHHRAEHWIVVSGTARVTVDDKVTLLQENQSTYIPAGSTHRLENPGKIPLHLIEVQCGSYLGEDDIVRFEDSYGRSGTAG